MNDERWLNRVREKLDRDADNLDAATASRLNQARQSALVAAGTGRSRRAWLPAGALATTAVLVLAVGLALRDPEPLVPPESQHLADLELLADEELELLSDLDFYLWLEAELDEENG